MAKVIKYSIMILNIGRICWSYLIEIVTLWYKNIPNDVSILNDIEMNNMMGLGTSLTKFIHYNIRVMKLRMNDSYG